MANYQQRLIPWLADNGLPPWREYDFAAGVLGTLEHATPQERIDGAQWYPIARETSRDIARVCGQPVDIGAAVLARLSPNLAWPQNILYGFEVASAVAEDTLPICSQAYPRNTGVAYDLARGLFDTPADSFNPATGPKIISFFHNILGDSSRVTVDTHAIRAALGNPNAPQIVLTGAQYRGIAASYQDAARKVGLAPSTLQAIVWNVSKRLQA